MTSTPFARARDSNAVTAGIAVMQREFAAGSQAGSLKSRSSSAVVCGSAVTGTIFGTVGGVILVQSVMTSAARVGIPDTVVISSADVMIRVLHTTRMSPRNRLSEALV